MTLLVKAGLLVPGVTPATTQELLTEGGDHLTTEADDILETEDSE